MSTYREPTSMKKHAALAGSRCPVKISIDKGLPPPPLYKLEVVLSCYFRNRVSFAAIAVFFCPQTLRPVAVLRAVRVAFRLTYCKDNYLRNRVSFAAIAVFFCPHAHRRVAAPRVVCVAFRLTYCKDM